MTLRSLVFRFLALSVLALLVSMYTISCSSSESSSSSKASIARAPGFTLADTYGKTIDFQQFQGKLVLVDFWATWCPPCRRSIPHLADLHKKYSNRGFEVVGISLDQTGPETVANFARDYAIPYTVLMGTQDVAMQWNIGSGIPVAFLVDREGAVVEKIVGYKDTKFWEEKIAKYL